MRQKNRTYPPNCSVSDLNPSRFLAFRAKQNEVEAEYGFRLCVPRRTQEQQDGYRRYMRDYRRRYQEAHRGERKAYRHAYWENVTKRGFDSLAEANGDEETLKRRAERKAAKQRRAELEKRKQEIHEQYGFWLNIPPKTPEEAAGRARYRKDQDAARKERNREKIAEYQKAHNAKRREERERKFQAKLNRLAAKDPVAAEKLKAKHEKLCFIQNMTHEERVRYRQQRQFEKLKAQEERRKANEERKARKAAQERLCRAEREKVKKVSARERLRQERARRRQEREAAAKALLAAEQAAEARFAAEREANRAAYLAAKAAMREEGKGKREENEPLAPAPAQPAINIADYLPSHPFRGLLLEDTAPADDEIAVDAATPSYADYAADEGGSSVPAAGGGSTPIDPPSRGWTTTGGSEEDDDDWRRREREEKIRRVKEQYGFTLGKKPVTPEEIEGKKRYIADRERETAIRNREIDFMLHGKERVRKEAAKKRKATIARKKREAAAQAAREAKAAEREALRKEREAARQAARVAKLEALETERAERAAFKAKARELGLPLQKARWTPKHQKIWDRALRREEKAKIEAERAAKRAARQGGQTAAFATSEERQKALEEKRRIVFEKYGFTLGKKPTTPEEMEGFKRWQRDQEAEYRERHRDHITEYNREYRRRKRQEALEKAQRKWSLAQWAAWERQQEAKERGTPAWLVREVARYLAVEGNLQPDDVMAWLIENDGVDFLTKGAESMGKQRLLGRKVIPMAARAVSFYCSPDTAAMFSGGERGMGNGNQTILMEV